MIKCEKTKSGFVIEMDGQNGDLIREIAHAAAAYHVRAINEFRKKNPGGLSDRSAITGSLMMFMPMMIEAMEKQLGIDKTDEKLGSFSCNVVPFEALKKKGGELQ